MVIKPVRINLINAVFEQNLDAAKGSRAFSGIAAQVVLGTGIFLKSFSLGPGLRALA